MRESERERVREGRGTGKREAEILLVKGP